MALKYSGQARLFPSTGVGVEHSTLYGFVNLAECFSLTLVDYLELVLARIGRVLVNGGQILLHEGLHSRLVRLVAKTIALGNLNPFDCRLDVCHSQPRKCVYRD